MNIPSKLEPKGLQQSPIKPVDIPKLEFVHIPKDTFMNALWNWLNGNKTIFGLAILQFVTYIPADTMVWIIPVVPILTWVGTALAGAGVVHKAIKSNTQPGPNA